MSSLISLADEAKATSFDQIPVVDLSNANSPNLEARRAIAQAIKEACTKVGFFYVKNHGVSASLVETAFAAGKNFFDLPIDEKMKIDIRKSPNFKGYTALLSENADPENRGDLHEGFDMGPESDENIAMSGSNVWPADPGFREAVLPYYDAVLDLGRTLFRLFALALELPEDFFADKTTQSAAIMRLLHYPPQTGVVDDRVQGIGAHSDYECFTILRQDTVPALQVLNNSGKWIDATPMPDTFVVNVGDQLARWTNDIFKSTVHRAINRSGVTRYSSPLFFGTDYNVVVEALPTCVSPERPSKYEPVLAGDYVKAKLEESYGHVEK
ncbi:Clavaminate synthase-like protein [Sistotremastrum suecicum HHB10207 ss-3]|uniref:Clavaminate synthase-like protein n=1 Tax=Sistotremastrum suecicum HHB10207 ss-3 TaxID=1314776 RepID=A0A166ADM6_9AGAM|nr:Clavaminate synthase-like protein [Sistotremastrum suecicum HHB10207 ss-3]